MDFVNGLPVLKLSHGIIENLEEILAKIPREDRNKGLHYEKIRHVWLPKEDALHIEEKFLYGEVLLKYCEIWDPLTGIWHRYSQIEETKNSSWAKWTYRNTVKVITLNNKNHYVKC